ncbi:hypothetical protein [Pleionea sp. CnH1-48]|uniref:hypothetical protein n=1 Tax=Pleionea sp. CnH1-48 TaxID=2954494 RepID=UPI00209714D4|nr:hypothetical protein [Pleionea sp. CnH1-48]MCO7225996.1 hypothetical protein [Pleionea sp. CnH1-48]
MKFSMVNILISLALACFIVLPTSSEATEKQAWEFRKDGKLQLNSNSENSTTCLDYRGGGIFWANACETTAHKFTLHLNGRLQMAKDDWNRNWNPWGFSGGACITSNKSNFAIIDCDTSQNEWHHTPQRLTWQDSHCLIRSKSGRVVLNDCNLSNLNASKHTIPELKKDYSELGKRIKEFTQAVAHTAPTYISVKLKSLQLKFSTAEARLMHLANADNNQLQAQTEYLEDLKGNLRFIIDEFIISPVVGVHLSNATVPSVDKSNSNQNQPPNNIATE